MQVQNRKIILAFHRKIPRLEIRSVDNARFDPDIIITEYYLAKKWKCYPHEKYEHLLQSVGYIYISLLFQLPI